MQSTRPCSNHRIATNLANWIVRLLSAQGNDLTSMAEVLPAVITSSEAASGKATTNLRNYALVAAKAPGGIVRGEATFSVHLLAETELSA